MWGKTLIPGINYNDQYPSGIIYDMKVRITIFTI